jgi:hypothetical protein
MKKYQKLIRDNIDLISEAEDSLMRVIDYADDYDFEIYESYLRSIFLASGQLEMIDTDYKYSDLSARAASVFANLLTAYARNSDELSLSHELVMRCLNLTREINDNLHYHSMRAPIFND